MSMLENINGMYFKDGVRVLHKVIRGRKRMPVGMVVALPVGDEIRLGYSLCNRKEDRWDRALALDLAVERALESDAVFPTSEVVPNSAQPWIERMWFRAHAYFKDFEHIETYHPHIKRALELFA